MTLVFALGCSGVQAPSCGSAYEGTIAALKPVFEGTTPPTFPGRAAYEARCAALGFSEAQVACLDPERARATPAPCVAALAPARAEIDALAAWFAAETVTGEFQSPQE